MLAGSATPLASRMTYSTGSSRLTRAATDSTRSSRIWQHTHPFARVIIPSSTSTTSSASTLIDPKSFTRTPTLSP